MPVSATRRGGSGALTHTPVVCDYWRVLVVFGGERMELELQKNNQCCHISKHKMPTAVNLTPGTPRRTAHVKSLPGSTISHRRTTRRCSLVSVSLFVSLSICLSLSVSLSLSFSVSLTSVKAGHFVADHRKVKDFPKLVERGAQVLLLHVLRNLANKELYRVRVL